MLPPNHLAILAHTLICYLRGPTFDPHPPHRQSPLINTLTLTLAHTNTPQHTHTHTHTHTRRHTHTHTRTQTCTQRATSQTPHTSRLSPGIAALTSTLIVANPHHHHSSAAPDPIFIVYCALVLTPNPRHPWQPSL